jgi:hypothetical protein
VSRVFVDPSAISPFEAAATMGQPCVQARPGERRWRSLVRPGSAEAASIVSAWCHDGCMRKRQRSVETTSTADHDNDRLPPSARFSSLPERIRPECMTMTQETEPPPDPEMGRDTDHDFLMRNLGG